MPSEEELNASMRAKGWIPNGSGGWTAPSRCRVSPVAQPKRDPVDAPVEPLQRETLYTGRVLVRITSYRHRSVDWSNEFPKYFVDCLRYCGAVVDDSRKYLTGQLFEVLIGREEEERTEIEVIPL